MVVSAVRIDLLRCPNQEGADDVSITSDHKLVNYEIMHVTCIDNQTMVHQRRIRGA